MSGVSEARFDIPNETFVVRMEAGVDAEDVAAAIRGAGYVPTSVADAPQDHADALRFPETESVAVRAALDEARRRSRPLVLLFGGSFCRLSRSFAERVLVDASVRDRLRAEFVFLEVDTEDDREAARRFGIRAVPDFWLLDPEGGVLARENRSLDVRAFLRFLDRASMPGPDAR